MLYEMFLLDFRKTRRPYVAFSWVLREIPSRKLASCCITKNVVFAKYVSQEKCDIFALVNTKHSKVVLLKCASIQLLEYVIEGQLCCVV